MASIPDNTTNDVISEIVLNGSSPENVTGASLITTTVALTKETDIFDRVLDGLNYVNYILLPTVMFLGIGGNILTIIVMNTKRYKHLTSRFFLMALAFSDTTLLLTQPFNKMFVIRLIGFDVRALSQVGCKFFFWFFRTGKMTSSWFVVFMCLERFVAVWFPLKAKLIVSKEIAFIGIAAVYLVIGTFNAFWTPNSKIGTGNICYPDLFDKSNPAEVKWYREMLTAGSSLYSLIPLCFLVTFTPLILYKLAKHRAKRAKLTQKVDNKSSAQSVKATAMLVSVVVAYLILILPITSLHNIAFYLGVKSFGNNTNRFLIFRDVAQILEQINYGINFFLYVLASQQFRQGLVELLRLEKLMGYIQRMRTTKNSRSGNSSSNTKPTRNTASTKESKDNLEEIKCVVDVQKSDGERNGTQEVRSDQDNTNPEVNT